MTYEFFIGIQIFAASLMVAMIFWSAIQLIRGR